MKFKGILFFMFFSFPSIIFSQEVKNVILMIGDGMGFNHIEATNNYYGYTQEYQSWDNYRVSTYLKTGFYNSDSCYNDFRFVTEGYTDSGAAATAMATGYKTHEKVIGLNENYYKVMNLAEMAELKNMGSGVVTSVQFNHATPAGFSAHVTGRYLYHEIASQMLIDSKLDVIIGSGHPYFDDNTNKVDKPNFKFIPEALYKDIIDNKIILTDHEGNKRKLASSDNDKKPDAWTFISSLKEFKELSHGKNIPKRLFGLTQTNSTLQEGRTGEAFNKGIPDLSMLSLSALNVLNQNKTGFFLMIEGGAIDWASHDSCIIRAIEETHDFNKSINSVVEWVEKNSNWDETLLIITADHETGFLTNTDVTDSIYNSAENKSSDILSARNKEKLIDGLKFNNNTNKGDICDHTNQLVPLYVKGKGADLFKTKVEAYKLKNLNFDRLSKMTYIDNTDIAKIIFKLLNAGKLGS